MQEGKPTFVAVDVSDDGSAGEKVVGFAQWELPAALTTETASRSASEQADEVEKDPLPASLDVERLYELYEKLEIETKKALGPDGHSKIWCKHGPNHPGLSRS